MPDIAADAIESPGCCVLTGTSEGPFVRLDRLRDDGMGTAYVAVAALEELASFIGRPTQQALDACEERAAGAEETQDTLEALQAAYGELLAAVGHTLRHGAVVRHGQIELRSPRSAKRTPDLHVLREAQRAGA